MGAHSVWGWPWNMELPDHYQLSAQVWSRLSVCWSAMSRCGNTTAIAGKYRYISNIKIFWRFVWPFQNSLHSINLKQKSYSHMTDVNIVCIIFISLIGLQSNKITLTTWENLKHLSYKTVHTHINFIEKHWWEGK